MNEFHTDVEWEKWGQKDPYFGVITDEKYRSKNLDEKAWQEFFHSGEAHVRHVLDTCRAQIDHRFAPRRILDFGCGVGRLVIPFAKVAEEVVGLDVSESMLQEARKNCERFSTGNVRLAKSDDHLSCLQEKFDLIHSFIVFQHIPPSRGVKILRRLLHHLTPGGIAAVQTTYSKTAYRDNNGLPPPQKQAGQGVKAFLGSILRKAIQKAATGKKVPLVHAPDPEMQMNPYNLNEIFFLVQSQGVKAMYAEFTDHGGELGVFLYFQKP